MLSLHNRFYISFICTARLPIIYINIIITRSFSRHVDQMFYQSKEICIITSPLKAGGNKIGYSTIESYAIDIFVYLNLLVPGMTWTTYISKNAFDLLDLRFIEAVLWYQVFSAIRDCCLCARASIAFRIAAFRQWRMQYYSFNSWYALIQIGIQYKNIYI